MATNPEEEAQRRVEEAEQRLEAGARSFGDSTQAAASRMGSVTDDLKDGSKSIDASVAQAEAGFRSLAQSAIHFGKTLSQNDDSLSKYNGAINAAGDGLAALASTIPFFGTVIGLAVKAFSALVQADLKQTDKIVANFNKLGELGAAAQFTSGELENMFNDAGFNTFNGQSQIMVKTVESLGNNLTKLGQTSGDGIKKFAQLASFNTDIQADQQKTRNEFANLGFSQEKLVSAQAAFMKEQGALGLGRKQVDNVLVKQSLDYTKNLSMLSALTGESAEAVKASREKDLEDFAFNVSLRQLGDDEAGKKQRELVQNMSTLIGSNVDETAKKAFMSVYANGAAVTSEAIALSTRTQGKFVEWTNEFKSGKLSPEDFINKLNQSGDAMLQSMGAALKASGETRDMMGLTTKTIENTAKSYVEGTLDATRQAIEDKSKHIDPYVGFANTVKNTTDQFAKMMDELLKLIDPLVMDAFKWLMDTVRKLAVGFMQSPMAKMLGLDFTDLLTSMTDSDAVNDKQIMFLHRLEEKQKQIDEASKLPSANLPGGTKLAIDTMKGELEKIRADLKFWQDEAANRGMKPLQQIPAVQPTTNPATTTPPKPSTRNTKLNPKQAKNATSTVNPDAPAPEFKFGGTTGPGFNNASEKLTGGGVYNGPMTGYRKQLPKGKDFAVVPLPSGDTIPVSFKNDMSMASMPADLTGNKSNPLTDTTQLSDMMSEIVNIFKQNDEETNPITEFNSTPNNRKSSNALESITDKLDTLLDRIRLNNNLQTELLDHARG
jgi:hypothetical protein